MVKILDNIFKAIKKAYYDDPFRILDIINSLNKNQEKSKEWLVEHIPSETSHHIILGGWYGNLANKLGNARSVDIDPGCKKYGKVLYPDVIFATDDMIDYLKKKIGLVNSIICTSCEHVEQNYIDQILEINDHENWITLQSNNYFEIDEHINCKNSLDDFLDELSFVDIHYAGKLKLDKFTRFMVIGK